MPKYTVKRFHDFSYGHRVVGHEGKCRHLHGHNGRIHFVCESEDSILDDLGRVIDFGEVKSRLCMWLEENWDHKFLVWDKDPLFLQIDVYEGNDNSLKQQLYTQWCESFVELPFNPTAENMAEYLVNVIGPEQLAGTGIELIEVTIEETRKCSVTYAK